MTDASEEETETTTEEATTETLAEDVVLDLESAEAYERDVDELIETVEQQQQQIEKLEALVVDLSTRVADGRDIGVCPDCHGPVERVRRWFRPSVIKCQRCGEVYHEY